jgi:CDP-diacylglycerol---glycerol-3-phosphate 3-phosphatidyltransferase
MERPERIVLVILGALFQHWGVMAPVLWVLAVLSTITVVHRIQYTYWNTKHLAPMSDLPPARTPAPMQQQATPTRDVALAQDNAQLPG